MSRAYGECCRVGCGGIDLGKGHLEALIRLAAGELACMYRLGCAEIADGRIKYHVPICGDKVQTPLRALREDDLHAVARSCSITAGALCSYLLR